MTTGKLQAGIILGLALSIGAVSSSADSHSDIEIGIWNLNSDIDDFTGREGHQMYFFKSFHHSSGASVFTCRSDHFFIWSIIPFESLGDLSDEFNIDALLKIGGDAPEKMSLLGLVLNGPDAELEVHFPDYDTFKSVILRLSRASNFAIRAFNPTFGNASDIRLPTTGLGDISPEFLRRCEKSLQ